MGILHTVFDLITALCGYVFQNNLITRERIVKYPTNKDTYALKRSAVDLSNIFSDFLYKSICCGYMFELPRYVYKSICLLLVYSFKLPQQMGTNVQHTLL